MNKRKYNLLGKKFGKLTVIDLADNSMWLCKCECGNEKAIVTSSLINGCSKSCGCSTVEFLRKHRIRHGYTRQGYISSEYMAWRDIKNRCYYIKDKRYLNYGGRGIKVCDRWLESFDNFIKDMGPKPSKHHSIERVNVNLNYDPTNCIWATMPVQFRNKTNNRWIDYEGRRMIITDWCSYLGINRSNINRHLKKRTIAELIEYAKRKGTINYDFVVPS